MVERGGVSGEQRVARDEKLVLCLTTAINRHFIQALSEHVQENSLEELVHLH